MKTNDLTQPIHCTRADWEAAKVTAKIELLNELVVSFKQDDILTLYDLEVLKGFYGNELVNLEVE